MSALQPAEIRFTHAGHTFKASVRFAGNRSLSRAFVWGPGDDFDPEAAVGPAAAAVAAPDIYTRRGVFPTVDKAWDAFNATIVAAKREALQAAIASLGYSGALKLKFSRKAGCSCGCSPGFILQDAPRGLELFITDETAEQEAKAAREAAKHAEAFKSRFDEHGDGCTDSTRGTHVTEYEDCALYVSELAQKRAAQKEGHEVWS